MMPQGIGWILVMGSYHWDLKKRQAPVNDITTDVRQDLDVDAKKVVLVEGDEHMDEHGDEAPPNSPKCCV